MAIINIPTKKQVKEMVNEAIQKETKWWETEYNKLWKHYTKLEERIRVLE